MESYFFSICLNGIISNKRSLIKWCSKDELNKLIEEDIIILHVREYEILNEILK